MIELPDDPAPTNVDVTLLDFGIFLRSSTGGPTLRIDRPGSRYKVAVTYPPMTAEQARKFVARWQLAKREGLRIDYPLLTLSQGTPGSPVVDGANPTGTTLPLKGLNPGYNIKEGYALTLIDADDNRYLHFVAQPAVADGSGEATIDLTLPIRAPIPDEAEVLLARPTVEGFIIEEVGWALPVDKFIRGGTIVIEEAA